MPQFAHEEKRLQTELAGSEGARKAAMHELESVKLRAESSAAELRAVRRSLTQHEGASLNSARKSDTDRDARLRLERLYARARQDVAESKGEHTDLQVCVRVCD